MERLKLTIAGESPVFVTLESDDSERCRQITRWLLSQISDGKLPAPAVGGDHSDLAVAVPKLASQRKGAAAASAQAAAKRAGALSVPVGGYRKR